MIRDLVLMNRSYRRFVEEVPVTYDTLRELVDLTRHLIKEGADNEMS